MVRTTGLRITHLFGKKYYIDIKIIMYVVQPLKYYFLHTFTFHMLIYFDIPRKSSFYKAMLNESGSISC